MILSQVLESVDLTTAHTILTLLGAAVCLYVMALTSYENEDINDPTLVRWGRRIGMGSISLALLWSLNYSMVKQWQPWPPELALIAALIFVFTNRAFAIHCKIRREGRNHLPSERSRLSTHVRAGR